MTLTVRSVKLRDSHYLLIPKDIARLLNVLRGDEFRLIVGENSIIYEKLAKKGEI